jgi:FMN phosphatase YigB (HAD superfamily)
VEAMQILDKHYKLFALSTVDNESFGRTLAGPLKGVKFDGIYTAENIGTYKPNPKNHHYCLNHI